MYPEDEIKQVFEALLQERKHVAELTAENEALCAQTQQLKRLLKNEHSEEKEALGLSEAAQLAVEIEMAQLKHALEEAITAHEYEIAALNLKHQEENEILMSDKDALIEQIELLGSDIIKLCEDNASKQEPIDKLQAIIDEYEKQLDSAKLHVAKKVLEFALLSERNEELQIQIDVAYEEISKEKHRSTELQKLLEDEKANEHEWSLKIENITLECMDLKEKYLELESEKLQLQQKLKDLKDMETKHLQLEEFFCGFGTILKNRCDPAPEKEPQSSLAEARSLFEMSPKHIKTKSDLFE